MSKPQIMLFALSTCSHCKSAKRLLEENQMEYDCVEVDRLTGDERKSAIEDVKNYNPRCSFPTLIIDGEVIVGYKEEKIKEALGL